MSNSPIFLYGQFLFLALEYRFLTPGGSYSCIYIFNLQESFTLKVEIQTENVHTSAMRFTHSLIKELIELEGKVSIALLSYVRHKMSKKEVEPGQFVFDRSRSFAADGVVAEKTLKVC